jgi:hypothetical protein
MTTTIIVPDTPATTPKPGYQSTEFIAMVLTAIGLPGLNVPPQYVPYVVALVIAYMALRTGLKAAHALGYAKTLPELPDLPAIPATPTTGAPA